MKMKKTGLILVLVLAMVLCSACAANKQEAKSEQTATEAPNASMANPMEETDAAGLLEKTGLSFGEVEGAQDVKYFVINGELGDMQLKKDGVDYDVRIQSAAEYTDISGMNYEWTSEEDVTVGGRDGKLCKCDEAAVVLWYDVAPGIMYSVSAASADADVMAVAEAAFAPLQGEAE